MGEVSSTNVSFGYLVPTREAVMFDDVAVRPMLERAARAEQLGYESIWVGDSIVARPRHEPFAMLAALAARTTSSMLGTAVLLPVLRDPVVMAHQAATVDQISEGRLVLGVGIATDTPTTHHEFSSVGVPFERRVGRLNAHLEICRRLWAGETVSHQSDFYSLSDVRLQPLPFTAGGPPIWSAGSTTASQRRAGERYDGWMPIGSADQQAAGLPEVRSAAQAAGRDVTNMPVASYVTVALHEDVSIADEEMNDFMAAYYPMPPEVSRAGQANYAGTPEGFVPWLGRFIESGSTHVIFRFAGRHDDHLEQCIDICRSLNI